MRTYMEGFQVRRLFTAAILILAFCAAAHAESGKLKIRVALVDRDLNVKPVPKLSLTLQPKSGAPVKAVTAFDGTAELDLAPGTYHLTNSQPVEFQGKKYSWEVDVTIHPGSNQLELSSDNARIGQAAPAGRATDELSAQFKHLQNTVVTVLGEEGSGTGFLIEPRGLIVTNQHVVGKSEFISVQFDPKRKVRATLLASDAQKDVAVLWANLSGIPEAVTAALPDKKEAPVIEGERVMTIGSPLSQRKILTTGVVSKVEQRAIISDIRIDHGNSGGPLFNSLGQVVGITTFGQNGGGAGVSGIVRIEEAAQAIQEARNKMKTASSPIPDLLPVEPETNYPIDALKKTLAQKKFDYKPYRFNAGDYWVYLITPPLKYYAEEQGKIQASQSRNKRNKQASSNDDSEAQDDLKSWGEYVGEYKPILTIRALSQLRETSGSMWKRSMLGPAVAATVRFKTDFYRMKLKCGDKEVQPIHPGKFDIAFDERNIRVHLTDEAYAGYYTYPPDAVSPSCGQVTLELYAQKTSAAPTAVKVLDANTVNRIWTDFEPYRQEASKAAK